MSVAALFSGGKDSTAALHRAYFRGLQVKGVCIARPVEDSLFFHYPYTELAVVLAEQMGLPYYYEGVRDDLDSVREFVRNCVNHFEADHIVAGVLRSDFQRLRLEYIARSLGKGLIAPLWGVDPVKHLYDVYKMGIRYVIVKSMARGIPKRLVGKVLELGDIEELVIASAKYKFNPSFEGGEAETLVVRAPLMRKALRVTGEVRALSDEVLNYFINHYELVDLENSL